MSRINYIRAGAAVFLMTCILSPLQTRAQEVPQWPATSQSEATAPSAIALDAVSSVSNQDNLIMVKAILNKAQILTLSEPIRDVVVTNEAIADVRINPADELQVFIMPKSIGASNILFMNENGNLISQIEVDVNLDADRFRTALKDLLPNENINVTVHGENIFLTGSVQSATTADKALSIVHRFMTETATVINMLNIVGSQQVIIKVRVAEMDRSIRKNLSVDVTGLYGASRNLAFTTTSPSTSLTAFVDGSATRVFNGIGNVTFEALESQNMIKTLAEPTLTALSGEVASFISGGEIPVPVGVDDNGNAVIEFQEYGIRLNFAPIVLSKGRIRLNIATEISEIDPTVTVSLSGLTVNGFKTKRAETTVDMPSGSTMLISGLLQDNSSDTLAGLPFLKDLPILGALFRSSQFTRDETELVITVSVYLAKPVGNETPLALPTDGFEPSSDLDIYLLGRLHREYGKGERPFWTNPLTGPFGYIVR